MLVWGKNVFNEIDLKKIRKVYLDKAAAKEYVTMLQSNQIRYDLVDKKVLDDMANRNHQGIVVDIYEYEYKEIDACFNDNFVVILDHLEDPHNFGAIIRTCECSGIKHIIIPKDRSVRVNETVIKVSSGAISHVDIIMVSNLTNAINKLKDNNFFIYGADMDGKDYRSLDFSEKKVLVIGNEGKGISPIVSQACDEIISIPMEGNINSLTSSIKDCNYVSFVKFYRACNCGPNAKDKDGNSLLSLAVKSSCLEIVKFLLDEKANPNLQNVSLYILIYIFLKFRCLEILLYMKL